MRFHSKIITVLFFIGVLVILLAPIKTDFNYYDEGFTVFNATRVMGGDAPYKDFWAIYPPGQFYVLAAIFRIFGTTLLVARIYDTGIRFLIVISVYLIADRITARSFALFACAITTLLLVSVSLYTYAVFPALAFGLLSILVLLEHVGTQQHRLLFLIGFLVGIATLFRWDIGLYAGISAVSTIIALRWLSGIRDGKRSIEIVSGLSTPLGTVSGTALLVALPCYGYLGLRSGFSNLWSQVVLFPTTMLHHVRWLPYPAFWDVSSGFPSWLQFYLPLIAYGIALAYYGSFFVERRAEPDPSSLGVLALTVFGALLFAQALSRYDYVHVVPSSVVGFLVILPLIRRALGSVQSRVVRASLFLSLALLALVYFLLPVVTLLFSINRFSPLGCYSYLERAGCVYVGRDQERAVEYIQTHTQTDEPIFIGNRQHDLIFINNIGFYFLAERPSSLPQ